MSITPNKPELVTAGAVSVRDTLNATEVIQGSESAIAAAAEYESQIKAGMILARAAPRRLDQFRLGLLEDCKRRGFAARGLYKKPVGRKKNPKTGEWEQEYAVNFSVRFIEAAIGHFTNLHIFERITYEDEKRARLTVQVLDIQRNIGYSTDRMLDKLVERKDVRGRIPRGERENSYGDKVYLVDATADEFRNLYGAERSKLRRDNAQRLFPIDILEECWEQIEKTLEAEYNEDPDAAKNKVLDAFYAIGVDPAVLEQYLGRPIKNLGKADIQELRAIYSGLEAGEFTWLDLMRIKASPAEDEAKPLDEGSKKLRDKLLGARKKGEPKPEQQTLSPEPPVES